MIIFSGLGGAIAGLGIILLIAYNWHELHRFTKLGIIFSGMLSLHLWGLRLFLKNERWRQFGDALCLGGSMLFGAGIWLVAQVYHIEEHFPNGFLIWGLGALTFAWVMPSIVQGLLAVIVLCIWGCTEAWAFDHALHLAPVFMLLSCGVLAWRLRSVLLLTISLAAFVLSLCANVSTVESNLTFRFLVSCSTAFAGIAVLTEWGTAFPKSSRVWQFFGWGGFLLCLYLLTFPSITEDLLGWREPRQQTGSPMIWLYQWTPLLLSLAVWGILGWRLRTQKNSDQELVGFESWLLPLSAVLCHVLALARFTEDKWFVASVFNLVFLALAAAWMARGARKGLVQPMVLGSVLLVALASARFFDLFESLAVRGFVFVMVGGILAVEGALFRKARRPAELPPLKP